MADIVTTLQNRNGDNLYPVAGGAAANSINAGNIIDGAITGNKITNGAVDSSKLSPTVSSSWVTFGIRTGAIVSSTVEGKKISLGGDLYLIAFEGDTGLTAWSSGVNNIVITFNENIANNSDLLFGTVTYAHASDPNTQTKYQNWGDILNGADTYVECSSGGGAIYASVIAIVRIS